MAAGRSPRSGALGLIAMALLGALMILRVQPLCAMPAMPDAAIAAACAQMPAKPPVHTSQTLSCAALCAATAPAIAVANPPIDPAHAIMAFAPAAPLHGLIAGPAPPPPRRDAAPELT